VVAGSVHETGDVRVVAGYVREAGDVAGGRGLRA
jgi:hypothetical protein